MTTLDEPELSTETTDFLQSDEFGLRIGEAPTPARSGRTFSVVDPATEAPIAEVADASDADVDIAAAAAREAFDDGRWRHLPPAAKEKRIHAFVGLLESHARRFIELDVLESGMPSMFAGYDHMLATTMAAYYGGWPTKIHGSIPPTGPDLRIFTDREPIGVCAGIIPWNVPIGFAVAKIMPAIACGNSVILKPAEQTPLTALALADLCLEAGIPPGVVNVITGSGPTVGRALVAHREVDRVAFTGSTEVGRAVHAATAGTLKRVSLELGGKNPNIIFADADLSLAIPGAVSAIFANSGQLCVSGSRLLVERSIHDEVVAGVVQGAEAMTVGSGFDESTALGPVISEQAMERILGYIDLGLEEGAQPSLLGERVGDRGYFVSPTVFTGAHNDMRISREEIFGPVVSIIPFDSPEEAYRLANDTEYGLAAGVWTQDVTRAHEAAKALRAGVVWVNTFAEADFGTAFGGMKQSGYGREFGPESIESYTETKATYIRLAPAT